MIKSLILFFFFDMENCALIFIIEYFSQLLNFLSLSFSVKAEHIFGNFELDMHLKSFVFFGAAISQGRILMVFFHAHLLSYHILKQCKKRLQILINFNYSLKPENKFISFYPCKKLFSVAFRLLYLNYLKGTIPHEWAALKLEIL